jgi:hypothetical protein
MTYPNIFCFSFPQNQIYLPFGVSAVVGVSSVVVELD